MRLFVAFCLILLLSACASTPTANSTATPLTAPTTVGATAVPPTLPITVAPETPQATQPTPSSGVLFSVVKPDGSKVDFTLDKLQKLPLTKIATNDVYQGPKLKDVLAAAGVTNFKWVYVAGKGGKVRLTPDQVDDNTILAFIDGGTVRLVTIYLNKQFWVQDVNRIEVQ